MTGYDTEAPEKSGSSGLTRNFIGMELCLVA